MTDTAAIPAAMIFEKAPGSFAIHAKYLQPQWMSSLSVQQAGHTLSVPEIFRLLTAARRQHPFPIPVIRIKLIWKASTYR